MKVSILVENTSKGNLQSEHGLSFHVEHNGNNYLIDTGKSGLFLDNANKMNIDLSNVSTAFLSHGHYDHSGGFNEFFNVNSIAKVYLQEACKQKQYYKIIGSSKKYIGIPKEILNDYDDRFIYVNGFKKINDNVFICPHTDNDFLDRSERTHMYSRMGDEFFLDDFSHEQTVVFEENNSLFIFNSCSHGGVENIIEEIKGFFPNKKIKVFFGGFHMMGNNGINSCNFSQEEVKNIGEILLDSSDAIFYTGHCTGNIASNYLKEILDDRFIQFHTGMVINL